MDAPHNQIFFPSSFNELFSAWNRFPDAVPYAGGTDLIWRQGNNILELPQIILCLDKLLDLHHITRTEHYLEIGAMVTLNKIIRLGKVVPEVLSSCLENIAGVQLRNLATIGGNICSSSRLLDAPAPLIALDAQYELRSAHRVRWVSAARFHSTDEYVLEDQELLTRIRLPIYRWDYSMFKKFYPEDVFSSKVLIFLAKTQKNILSDIRVVYKGNAIFRNKNSEAILAGSYLPLNRKIADDFIKSWDDYLRDNQDIDDFTKDELVNIIELNIKNLSE